jgi:signal transduction histidine kinase
MSVSERLRARLRRHPHADLAMGAIVYVVTLLTTAASTTARLDAAALVIAGAACGALIWRLDHPFVVLAVSAVAAEAYLAHVGGGNHGTMVLAAPLIALYTVADLTTRRGALIIGVLVVLAFGGLHTLGRPASWLGAENIALAALGGLAVAAGHASRSRRAYLAEVEARAKHAESDREAEAARRVTEERLRIARDLHDSVGHHLALIYVQAGVAEHVLDSRTGDARTALRHVRSASRTALIELGDTIGLLRQPGEPAAPTVPLADLAGLDDLVATFQRSGLVISTHVEGPVRPVPAPAGLAAYRVIQESLTNVCKHAGLTRVNVSLAYEPDGLRIVIDNEAGVLLHHDGEAEPPGHGLLGMRERVAALGGSLLAQPRPDGGFRVSAVLPLQARPA